MNSLGYIAGAIFLLIYAILIVLSRMEEARIEKMVEGMIDGLEDNPYD